MDPPKHPLTFLYLAAITSNTSMIRTILSTEPNISIMSSASPTCTRTHLHLTPSPFTDSLITFILSEFTSLALHTGSDRRWSTVLHHAVEDHDTTLLQLALSHGADTNQRNWAGNTPLHTAAWTGSAESARILLDMGADAHAVSRWGRTPLQDACRRYNTKKERKAREAPGVLWLLLESEAGSYEDQDGRPLLHLAAQYGHIELVKELVDDGEDLARTDAYGRTVLHAAAKQGNGGMVRFLLKWGADWMAVDHFGRRAVDVVPEMGGEGEVLKGYLESGVGGSV